MTAVRVLLLSTHSDTARSSLAAKLAVSRLSCRTQGSRVSELSYSYTAPDTAIASDRASAS